MFIVIYKSQHDPEKRIIWNLSDKQFPSQIDPTSVIQILATSFEERYARKEVFGNCNQNDWRGEDAQYLFSHLKSEFETIFDN